MRIWLLLSVSCLAWADDRLLALLKKECATCHAGGKAQGGLSIGSMEALERGGKHGPALEPGSAARSLLFQHVTGEKTPRMPLGGELPAQFITDLRAAIDALPKTSAAATKRDPHWEWLLKAPVAPTTPSVKQAAWVRNPIDAFVLTKLEQQNIVPAPEASRRTLLRRLYFDLLGIPPTPEQVREFAASTDPQAYEKVIDQLLADPRYGERWGRHWLDLVRYAESDGFAIDSERPTAWRYRDYVIRAFNRDKPYDLFVQEQIAGDEYRGKKPAPTADRVVALGFLRFAPWEADANSKKQLRQDHLNDITGTVGSVFLGMTTGCAQCHDHKYDPIPQKDYYRLQAYLAGTQEYDLLLISAEEKKILEHQSLGINNELKRLRRAMDKAEGLDRERIEKQIEEQESNLPPGPATIPGIRNVAEQRTEMHVLKRGVWENKGEQVAPRPLSVLVNDTLPELSADSPKPRSELANWLTDPKQPLTPRVAVNRIWQQHFGMGLVKTPNDFGANGDRPSHPELLDWLASELVGNGWKLKPLHRMILLSSAYQQSSQSPMAAAATRLDPENRWLWEFNRRRLSAEEIRDAMLAVSGRLNLKQGGRSVMVPVDKELVRQLYKPLQWEVARDTSEHARRSIYMIAKRNLRVPFMEVFDAPALLTSCPARESSTHAPQALEMLNGRLSNELADAFARRLLQETGGNPQKMVERACWIALGRPPTREERNLSVVFLRDGSPKEFALSLFNLNAFLYVQ